MIPPLLLEIKKNDRCLDCCAAPGSKTAQCLVALGRDAALARGGDQQQQQQLPFDYSGATGFVVANELDEKRSHMLVHQCKRLRALYPFAVFTNHDARYFPNPILPAGEQTAEAAAGAATAAAAPPASGEFFDKVLCDVMCSGDGTIRKAAGLLRAWRPFEAAHIQKSQIQVALRGAHLLRVGGRIVYSTCSMNPIENEAVVSQILLRTQGALRLLDPRAILPQLPCDPGMRTWKVMRNDGSVAVGPEPAPGQLHPALFPVPGADYPLERCMRLLPHHTDGGGFFIALFEKVAPFVLQPNKKREGGGDAEDADAEQPKENNNEEKQEEGADDAAATKKPLKGGFGEFLHQSLMPFSPAPRDVVERDVVAMFNISTSAFPLQNLVYRTNMEQHAAAVETNRQQQQDGSTAPAAAAAASTSGTASAAGDQDQQPHQNKLSNHGPLQLVSSGVRDLLLHQRRNLALRISAAGLRTFVPQPGMGSWRVSNEASAIVSVGMVVRPPSASGGDGGGGKNPRLITGVSVTDVLPMINSGPLKDVQLDQIPNEALRKQVEALEVGCVVMLVRSDLSLANGSTNYLVACPALRARTKLQLLVDQEDLEGLQCRLGIPPKPKKQGGGRGAPAAEAAAEDD
jgi:tRNA (cytosine34-C5)-methyltransferase